VNGLIVHAGRSRRGGDEDDLLFGDGRALAEKRADALRVALRLLGDEREALDVSQGLDVHRLHARIVKRPFVVRRTAVCVLHDLLQVTKLPLLQHGARRGLKRFVPVSHTARQGSKIIMCINIVYILTSPRPWSCKRSERAQPPRERDPPMPRSLIPRSTICRIRFHEWVGALVRTAADNQTVRNVFVASPDNSVKLVLVDPMTTGRTFDGLVRVVDSLQLTAVHKVATPANWQPGDNVIISGSVSDEQARELFGRWESPRPYIRIVPQPQVREPVAS
jgi:hypothetical protein